MQSSAENTHTDKAPLALGVAKHLVHGALLEGEAALALKLVWGMQGAAGLGQQQDVGKQEEHLGFGLHAFRGHSSQPALADIPST